MQCFRRGFQTPWHVRKNILDQQVVHEGQKMVPWIALRSAMQRDDFLIKERLDSILEGTKAEALKDQQMPAEMEAYLGPESIHDVFARVDRAERHDIVAH